MRPRSPSPFRSALIWLLACLVPLQALAAGVIAVAGPSHTHLPAAATRLVLDDFRRSQPRLVAEAHVDSALSLLHSHAHGGSERHRHAGGDATVVVDAGDRLLDADDHGTSPSLAVFVGLISASPPGVAGTTADRAAAPPRWQPQTHLPALPERPPRATA